MTEEAKKLYHRYKQDPNWQDCVNSLIGLMESYRWSSGDHSAEYEKEWHQMVALAEAIHEADEKHINID